MSSNCLGKQIQSTHATREFTSLLEFCKLLLHNSLFTFTQKNVMIILDNDGDFLIFHLVVELDLEKCRQRFGCLPWIERPTLA